MRSHPADTLVSLGGQRVARAAATHPPRCSATGNPCGTDAVAVGRNCADVRNGGQCRHLCFVPSQAISIPASEAEAWKDPVEALADYGPRHPAKPKRLSDRMNVGE